MSEARPAWPANPRPFVAYRAPLTPQPTRSDSLRDVWEDVRRFLERAAEPYPDEEDSLMITARRWSAESMRGKPASWFGEWPAECSVADFDAAVRLANERFGKPKHRSSKARLKRDGEEEEMGWHVRVDRVDEVLDFLERVPTCTGGEWAPVRASYCRSFRLRDLETGEVLPHQEERYHPMPSSLSVLLQRRSAASLVLVLPFAQPDDGAVDYVVALQEHLPVYLDPRYFDHMTPASDGSRYHRLRLPPGWVGLTPDGEPRLDASRSGITPAEVDLPSDAEMDAEDPKRDNASFYAHYAAVEGALLEHAMAAALIRGAPDLTRHLVKQAAERLGIPLHVVSTMRPSRSQTLAAELRATLSGLEGRPSVLLVELDFFASRKANATVLAQAATRVLEGVEIPAPVRLVMTELGPVGEAARAASARLFAARDDGFGSARQIQFLVRQEWRTAYRDVAIVLMPLRLANDRKTSGGMG
jgi:hypothetical protein